LTRKGLRSTARLRKINLQAVAEDSAAALKSSTLGFGRAEVEKSKQPRPIPAKASRRHGGETTAGEETNAE